MPGGDPGHKKPLLGEFRRLGMFLFWASAEGPDGGPRAGVPERGSPSGGPRAGVPERGSPSGGPRAGVSDGHPRREWRGSPAGVPERGSPTQGG
jgi:hypothetical protein